LIKRLILAFFLISSLQPLTSIISEAQTLDEYLQEAAENNPELKAYYNDYLAAMQRVPQAGALPDPTLSAGFFPKPMERYMGNETANIQLMQMFPWFGTLRQQKDEASQLALAQYEAFRIARNSLTYQVKDTWYQLYHLETEIKLTREALSLWASNERLALTRMQNAGASGAGMTEVLRIRMERKELENRLDLLTSSRRPLQAAFNTLLNRNIDDLVKTADTLYALSAAELILLDSIAENNPRIKMLDAEVEAVASQKKLSRLQGRPMLGLGAEYMLMNPRTENGMSMGGNNMVMPMVSLSLPISRKKYDAMEKEAELKQAALKHRREHTVNELATEWSEAVRDLEDAGRRSKLYRDQGELAKQTLDLLMAAYVGSGDGFEELLRVQRQMLDYQLRFNEAVVDQHTAVARLEMLVSGD